MCAKLWFRAGSSDGFKSMRHATEGTRSFIIDLDDTLLATGELYFDVREEFVSAVAGAGFDPEIVRNAFEDIEETNMKNFGHSPDRYMSSMEETVKRLNKNGSTELLQRVREIGSQIRTRQPALVGGALNLIEDLKKRGPVFLLTRGDGGVQERKIKHYGLDSLVSGYLTFERKTQDDYLLACTQWKVEPNSSWVIGDSIPADVNPGLQCGFNVIHTAYPSKRYAWRQDAAKPESWRFFHVSSLCEIPRVIDWETSYKLSSVAGEALQRSKLAYAPYSGFHVGAGAISSDGRVFFGVNVENASLGLTVDAEQSALASAILMKGQPIVALAIAATDAHGELQTVSPCGKCRQWCVELMAPDAPIASVSPRGVTARTVSELLPEAFETYAQKAG